MRTVRRAEEPMTAILGVSAFYHDSAARGSSSMARSSQLLQEERFTRKKHDPAFPVNAIDYC